MMETGSGNSGTTLKNQNLIQENRIFILGIMSGAEKMRKKEKIRQRDTDPQCREKEKMKKKKNDTYLVGNRN